MNRKPKKQTERGDVAHVMRFLEERGDVARQIDAHLAKETDYQERLRRPIVGGLEVVFVQGDVTEAPWITPYGQLVLPKSPEEKRQAWRQWEDSMRDGETRPKKASAWVARTIACAEEAGGSDDKRTLFWIFALECVERFELWLREWREGLERFCALENEQPSVDPRYAPTVQAHDAALALLSPLNDWDRLVLTPDTSLPAYSTSRTKGSSPGGPCDHRTRNLGGFGISTNERRRSGWPGSSSPVCKRFSVR